ncbi:NLRC3 [Symbiodinium microadriaticum]|nr:NLRC3 [Symbiodinium microadriaticum]
MQVSERIASVLFGDIQLYKSETVELVAVTVTPYFWRLRQQKIVEGLRYWKAARPQIFDHHDLYFFIDYICLPQFRRCAAEEAQFQKAMSHMHLLYANSAAPFCKVVWRLEKLTPSALIRQHMREGRRISVYNVGHERLEELPLQDLKPNCVPYQHRGWCRAELEWAKPWTLDISSATSCLRRFGFTNYTSWFHRMSLPMTPEAFRGKVGSQQLKFTHRGDMEPVMRLQETVFYQKLAAMESFRCSWLRHWEIPDLLELVGRLQALQGFFLASAYLSGEQQVALVSSCLASPVLHTVGIQDVPLDAPAVGLLARARLTTLKLGGCSLRDVGAVVVASALKNHPTLEMLSLCFNGITDRGALALAECLSGNGSLEHFDLRFNHIGCQGAMALAGALNENTKLTVLDLLANPIRGRGACDLRAHGTRIRCEVLEMHPDSSWVGWICCVLRRLFTRMALYVATAPMRFFAWWQRLLRDLDRAGIAKLRLFTDGEHMHQSAG